MRSLHAARSSAQKLADIYQVPYCVWAIQWRCFTMPEGKDVPGGQLLEYIYPTKKEEFRLCGR